MILTCISQERYFFQRNCTRLPAWNHCVHLAWKNFRDLLTGHHCIRKFMKRMTEISTELEVCVLYHFWKLRGKVFVNKETCFIVRITNVCLLFSFQAERGEGKIKERGAEEEEDGGEEGEEEGDWEGNMDGDDPQVSAVMPKSGFSSARIPCYQLYQHWGEFLYFSREYPVNILSLPLAKQTRQSMQVDASLLAKPELAYGLAMAGQTDSQVGSQVHASRKKS